MYLLWMVNYLSDPSSDLPEQHRAARVRAVAKMKEIVSDLRSVNDIDAMGVVRHAVGALELPLVLASPDEHGKFPTVT